jgi:carbon-monoxide dehydrogenase medium subunit
VVFEDGNEQPLTELMDSARKPSNIVALSLPLDVQGRCWAEARTGETPEDFPIVWAMAVVDMEGDTVKNACVALTGTSNKSVSLAEAASQLGGKPLDAESIDQTAALVEKEVSPKGDYRGSVEYRSAMAGVMTRRALQACKEGEIA